MLPESVKRFPDESMRHQKSEGESLRLSPGLAVRTRLTLRAVETAPEPRQRGGVVMADQAVCSRPAFFPFRSADVGCPKSPRRVPETAPEKQT